MLIGLNDFNTDIFLVTDDEHIFLYYSDFETIPELANLVPLGSFDDVSESLLWIDLEYKRRIEVAILFMQRDLYAGINKDTKEVEIDREIFMNEFSQIPEVTLFFDQYKDICKHHGELNYPAPDTWLTWDRAIDLNWFYQDQIDGKYYIDWATYPQWCQACPDYTYDDPVLGELTPLCASTIPIYVMPPSDLYFISVVYFNGIYRTNPESIQNFGLYDVLTDVDFEKNKYSLVVDIPKFFTNEFQWFLQTVPGSIPFASDYGTHIKHAIQTKDAEIRRIEIENEINFFIHNFNNIYNSLVAVRAIKILSRENQSGGNSWLIEVEVVIEEEILTLRVESAE